MKHDRRVAFTMAGVALLATACSAGRDPGPAAAQPKGSALDADHILIPGNRIARRDCIRHVPNGGTLDADGNILLDGKIVEERKECSEPTQPAADDNGWVEWSWQAATPNSGGYAWFSNINVNWTVPDVPPNFDGQYIYLWMGLSTPLEGFNAIVQPVLAYGFFDEEDNGNTPPSWQMMSWYIWYDDYNPPTIGPIYNVSPGDTIQAGVQAYTPCTNDGTNCWYSIGYWANSGSVGSALWYVNTYEQPAFNIALNAVLEVHYIDTCNDLPGGTSGAGTIFKMGTLDQAPYPWGDDECPIEVTPSFIGDVDAGPGESINSPPCDWLSTPYSGSTYGTTLNY